MSRHQRQGFPRDRAALGDRREWSRAFWEGGVPRCTPESRSRGPASDSLDVSPRCPRGPRNPSSRAIISFALGFVHEGATALAGRPSRQMARRPGDFGSLLSGFGANDFVSFDYGGDAHTGTAVFRLLVHANHLAHGADKDFGASRHLGGQREGDIQFGAGTGIIFEREIDAAGGDVARLSVSRRRLLFDRNP